MKSARSVDTQSFRSLATLLCEQNARHTLKRLLGNSRLIPNAKRRKLLCQIKATDQLSESDWKNIRDWEYQCSSGRSPKSMADTLIFLAKLVTWEHAADSLQELFKENFDYDDGSPLESTKKLMRNEGENTFEMTSAMINGQKHSW